MIPADYETDEFVQACDKLKAAPGTRICQVSETVKKLVAKSGKGKRATRDRLQKQVAKHYQQMGILAVYAPGAEGLKVAEDGSTEAGKISGKGSIVFLSQDASSF